MIEKYKISLIEPLDSEELHIFNSTYKVNSCINDIVNIIRNKAYGIYLVGGMRGCGKTSLMNLCHKIEEKNKCIKVNIDSNKIMEIENFIYFFIYSLSIEAEKNNFTDDIINDLIKLKNIVMNGKKNYKTNEANLSNIKTNVQVNEEDNSLNINFISNFLKLGRNKKSSNNVSKTNEYFTIERSLEETIERNDLFIVIERLSQLLNKISTDYKILLVIDELDKRDKEFIIDLIDNYKNLLFNSKIITFLIVDTLTYIDIVKGNELNNKLLNYIIKSIYVPTNNLNEIKNYLYREYGVVNYEEIYLANYQSLGIYRKLNLYKYLTNNEDNYIFSKSYLFYFILNYIENYLIESYYIDCFKVFLKDMIEKLFEDKYIMINYIEETIRNNDILYKKDFLNILKLALNSFSTQNKSIKLEEVGYKNKYILQLTYNENFELKLEHGIKHIEFKLNYRMKINSYLHNNNKYQYIKITTNDTDSYHYVFRFINTLNENIENIIIVKKIFEAFGVEQSSYSIIIDINKKIGRILYCIEDFSFSYEYRNGIESVRKFLTDLNIKIIEVEIDDEPISENIEYIMEKAGEIINVGY